jgi:hypothetical protein
MARKFRIATSMFFAAMAMALCVLWMRSTTRRDGIFFRYWPTRAVEISSSVHRIELAWGNPIFDWPHFYHSYSLADWEKVRVNNQRGLSRGNTVGRPWELTIHYVLLIALASGFAIGPWFKSVRLRFTLRTLLIATTLVAVVLGLGVWAAR